MHEICPIQILSALRINALKVLVLQEPFRSAFEKRHRFGLFAGLKQLQRAGDDLFAPAFEGLPLLSNGRQERIDLAGFQFILSPEEEFFCFCVLFVPQIDLGSGNHLALALAPVGLFQKRLGLSADSGRSTESHDIEVDNLAATAYSIRPNATWASSRSSHALLASQPQFLFLNALIDGT